LTVLRAFAGFGGADGGDRGAVHGVLPSSCIYRLGQGVYTGQAHLERFPNVRFERVA
jgi:hypothetical protein